MRHAHVARAGEATAVDQRRVIELVGNEQIVAAEQRAQHAEIRGPAAAEQQRALTTDRLRQRLLESRVFFVEAADQRRSAAAGAGAPERIPRGLGDAYIRGESEIVVAAEVDAALAVDDELDAVRARYCSPRAIEIRLTQSLELDRES